MSKINWDQKVNLKVSERHSEVTAIKAELAEIDLACVRPLVTMIIHGENPEDVAILKALEEKAKTLRAKLPSLD